MAGLRCESQLGVIDRSTQGRHEYADIRFEHHAVMVTGYFEFTQAFHVGRPAVVLGDIVPVTIYSTITLQVEMHVELRPEQRHVYGNLWHLVARDRADEGIPDPLRLELQRVHRFGRAVALPLRALLFLPLDPDPDLLADERQPFRAKALHEHRYLVAETERRKLGQRCIQ